MITDMGYTLSGIEHLRMSGGDISIAASKSFEQAYNRGRRNQLLAKILNRSNQLKTLTSQSITSRGSSAHIVSVPIRQIKGTLGRSTDFDASFNPIQSHSRSRWISLFIAYRQGVTLPAVELVQDGETFYVRDGHHRISVAKTFGQRSIDAIIVN
jgi:hypothetical protein